MLDRHRRSPHAPAVVPAADRPPGRRYHPARLTKCGGLSEGRKLGWIAYDHGVLLVPHGWNTAIGVAADLALSAALPVARWVEYQTGVPYIEAWADPSLAGVFSSYQINVPQLDVDVDRLKVKRPGMKLNDVF